MRWSYFIPRDGCVDRASLDWYKTIGAWIVLPAILTVVLFALLVFLVIIPSFENIALSGKREVIRELIHTACSELDYYYELEVDGTLTRAQAQAAAKDALRKVRYGTEHKDYFWINDLTPTMIMHPYRPELEGSSLADYRDSHGDFRLSQLRCDRQAR